MHAASAAAIRPIGPAPQTPQISVPRPKAQTFAMTAVEDNTERLKERSIGKAEGFWDPICATINLGY